LLTALKEGDSDVRQTAAETLGAIKDAGAVEPLIAALKDGDWRVRSAAAEALGAIKDLRAVEALIAITRLDKSVVQDDAAKALGAIKAPGAVEPLIAALKNDHWQVRLGAAQALGAIGDPRAVEPLIAALKHEEDPAFPVPHAQKAAAEALGYLGKTRAVKPLIAALRHGSSSVRERAAEALGAIGDQQAVEPLTQSLREWGEVGRESMVALFSLGWRPKTYEDVVVLLVCARGKTPLLAIWPETKRTLLAELQSDSLVRVVFAVHAFIWLGNEDVIPDLITTLNRKGDRFLAEVYLNCGNERLHDAAVWWANSHGYTLEPGVGGSSVRWGKI